MNNWVDGYISGNGLKIHYYRTGRGKPPVVINHGAGDDGLCWTRVVNILQKDYDVIMPDARGHGKSSSGKGNYSAEARITDLFSLVTELDLDRPVIGGHSLGADTSLHFAAAFPDKVRGIFLEDPPIIPPRDNSQAGQQVNDAGKMMARSMRVFKILPKFISIPRARKMSPLYPDDEIIPWINSKRRVSFDFLGALPQLNLQHSHPLETLKQVVAPILLFIGDQENSAIVSQETAQEIARANEKVKIVYLAGASHDIRRTRFDGYMPALQAFLSGIYQT